MSDKPTEQEKPKPTKEDIQGPIMRFDFSRRDMGETDAINAKMFSRESSENSKTESQEEPKRSEKREE